MSDAARVRPLKLPDADAYAKAISLFLLAP
jgi:hypothetical protein